MLVIVIPSVSKKSYNVIAKVIVTVLVCPLLKFDKEHGEKAHLHSGRDSVPGADIVIGHCDCLFQGNLFLYILANDRS